MQADTALHGASIGGWHNDVAVLILPSHDATQRNTGNTGQHKAVTTCPHAPTTRITTWFSCLGEAGLHCPRPPRASGRRSLPVPCPNTRTPQPHLRSPMRVPAPPPTPILSHPNTRHGKQVIAASTGRSRCEGTRVVTRGGTHHVVDVLHEDAEAVHAEIGRAHV